MRNNGFEATGHSTVPGLLSHWAGEGVRHFEFDAYFAVIGT